MWLLVVLAMLPPASILGVVLWARALSRQRRGPPFAAPVAYVLALVGALALLVGYVSAALALGQHVANAESETSDKARALAEGISEILNCGTLAVLVAVAAAGWLGFWTWRTGRGPRR